jgi:hypothetical protein
MEITNISNELLVYLAEPKMIIMTAEPLYPSAFTITAEFRLL